MGRRVAAARTRGGRAAARVRHPAARAEALRRSATTSPRSSEWSRRSTPAAATAAATTSRAHPIGGRHFGRNEHPGPRSRRVLRPGVAAARRHRSGCDVSPGPRADERSPAVRSWVAATSRSERCGSPTSGRRSSRPTAGLDRARGSGRYLREITAPGVDTKFVERHRELLARLLGVDPGAAAFVAGLGLRAKPATVRLRFDPAVLGLPVRPLRRRRSVSRSWPRFPLPSRRP